MRSLFARRTLASSILRLTFLITLNSLAFGQEPALTLNPDPGGSTACKPITLQAALKPSSAGTVQFFETVDKSVSNLGKPQKVDGSGNATLTISLPMGTHNLSASFQPDGSSKPSLTAKEQSFAVGPATACDQPVDIVQIITGVSVSAASSANPSAVFVAASVLDVPVASKNVRLSHVRNWISGDLRISGIAQPGAISSNASVANYFSTAVNTTPDHIVQSVEVQARYGLQLYGWSRYTTALDAGTSPNGDPKPALFTLSFIAGGGAITPLSVNQVQSAVYNVSQPIYNCFNQVNFGPPCNATNAGGFPNANGLPSTCNPSSNPTSPCYVAFVPEGRSRFFRHYEGGFRLKIYAHDYSEDPANAQLRFPGIIDLTVGQNEYVTGGIFHGPVVHIGGSLPVPRLDGWYAFGSGDFALQKNVSEPQILFTQAGGNVTLATSNVFVVPTPQPNRDRYMLGVGIDLYHLIAKYKSGGGSKAGQ